MHASTITSTLLGPLDNVRSALPLFMLWIIKTERIWLLDDPSKTDFEVTRTRCNRDEDHGRVFYKSSVGA